MALLRTVPRSPGSYRHILKPHKKMKEIYRERSLSMKEADQNCAADPDWFRKTTFTGMAVILLTSQILFPGCPINWTISVNAKQTLCT